MKRFKFFVLTLWLTVGSGFFSGDSHALSFHVDYSGSVFGNSAEAHGWVDADNGLFPASSGGTLLYPGIEITGLVLRVTSASSGNGVFYLSDFDFFSWSTLGATLDFSMELIGQPTLGGGWGTTFDGFTGDFNLFSATASAAPFSAGSAFVISTNHGVGDFLSLVSFRPVPEPSMIWLMGVGWAVLMRFRRYYL